MNLGENDLLLNKLLTKEKQYGLYDYKINDISVFRILRFQFRVNYINKKIGYTNRTSKHKIDVFKLIYSLVISLYSLFKIFSSKNKIIFFAFPRLNYLENLYLDKFTDPIIDKLNKNESIIFQRNLGFKIHNPRYNKDIVRYIDFIILFSKILSIITLPYYFIAKYKYLKRLSFDISKVFELKKVNRISIAIKINSFFIEKFIYKQLFRVIKPKALILVNRMIHPSAILAAKQLNIKTFELQHGITITETTLYTGEYDEMLDTEYFLSFGEIWKNHFFGMPINKIQNIGWAYKNMVSKISERLNIEIKDTILIISQSSITDQLLNLISEINLKFQFKFELRLHPQEALNVEQLKIIKKEGNIIISERNEDSFLSLMRHRYIIGDNSTVMYEALSLGKKVAQLNLNEFKKENLENFEVFDFYQINKVEDILQYIKYVNLKDENHINNGVYDDFNIKLFKDLIDKNKK